MKKEECSALLWSFNFLSKLMGAANVNGFVRIRLVVRYMKVVYLTTKMIQIKLYTICSSHQLGLEVERPEWSTIFFIFLLFYMIKRHIYANFFRLHIQSLKFPTCESVKQFGS